jgi:hypothetical protein
MCGPNFFLVFAVLYAELSLLGSLASHVDSMWLWLWTGATFYVGWRLLKGALKHQTTQHQGVINPRDRRVLLPVGLMIPGLMTDLAVVFIWIWTTYQRSAVSSRPRDSSLWVGQPDSEGTIPVEGVRVPNKTEKS